jgi:hypothetical protein
VRNSLGRSGNWRLAPKARLCLAKYLSLFVRKYPQRYPQPCARLRRHVYLHLNNDLCLNLNLDLDLNLLLFLKSFQ